MDVSNLNDRKRYFFHLPWVCLTLLPNDKILAWFKLNAFADEKINEVKMVIFVFDSVENIVGKGENAG